MKQFAPGFLIGAATAAHQVEGNNTNSDCWAAEQMRYTNYTEPSLDACDHYHKYAQDIRLLAEYMQKEPVQARCVLDTLLVLRKIERIGDHCSNIVEEIVFYIDAKILKHNRNKE